MTTEHNLRHMVVSLLQGFYWFDEGLQNYLQARGWPEVTRPQSMVMANIVLGVDRPSDIARRLGVSRQAIHTTISQMIDLGMLALADDPKDRRTKVCVLTPVGEDMRHDAQEAMQILAAELSRRLGKRQVAETAALLVGDWGAPVTFDPEKVRTKA